MSIVTKKFKLTNTKVRALPTPTDRHQVIHWCSEVQGFGVRVTTTGAKSWIVQGRVGGKSRRATIGPIDLLSSDEARKRAQVILLEMYDGKDPRAEKRKQKAQHETLREVMEDYIANKRTKNGPLRDRSKTDIRYCVEKIFSDWADKPVAGINRDGCIKKFRAMSKTAPTKANQSFRYLRALLNWAREKSATDDGHYSVLPVNPVAHMFKGGLVQWNKEKPRTTRIPKDKIGAVWLVLEQCGNPNFNIPTICASADLVSFMLLTGSRIGEASSLTWDRVNLDDDLPTFHFDEDITKNHNPVYLPMSDALVEVTRRRLAARTKRSDFVFPSSGKSGHITDPRTIFTRATEAAGVHLHAHSMRRTFEDIAQIVGVDADQRRQLLNHLASDVHGQSYANNPDPSSLLEATQSIGQWVKAQGKIAQDAASGENIVALHG